LGKVAFSHKIEDKFAECFEKMCGELGPPKYRILEASIEVFDALPREIQYRLRGMDQVERKPCLDMLAGLSLTAEPLNREPGPGVAEYIETIRQFATRYKIPDKEWVLLLAQLRKALGPARMNIGSRDIAAAVEDDIAARSALGTKKRTRPRRKA
jgi:hypothetical protein